MKTTRSERAQAAAWRELELAEPPVEPRRRELWIQHAAGAILFERVRAAGLAAIDAGLERAAREVATDAVDATIYALMMLIDGVSGGLEGHGRSVDLTFGITLTEGDQVTQTIDLSHGDGMCMGYHSWRAGNFGDAPVLSPKRERKTRTKREKGPATEKPRKKRPSR